jgi:regulator of protease activity HflC (stomatin/prohibitin superfamily)
MPISYFLAILWYNIVVQGGMNMFYIFITLGIVLLCILPGMIIQINEYERGIKFSRGKFKKIMNPGWHIVVPIFQSYKKVDVRTKAVDVPAQEAITKDNVSIKINAVLYYKIFDASKAILGVENYYYAISQLAQTTMRNGVGSVTLDELLVDREKISTEICKIIDELSDPWGIKVENVELKDIALPEEMQRVIAKVAEAEREKQAVITKAQGEVEASENLTRAANNMAKVPGALHLRTLSTINDVSSDQSNTIIFAMPIEVLRAFEAIGEGAKLMNPQPMTQVSSKNEEVKKEDE